MQEPPGPSVHVFHEEKQLGPFPVAAVRDILSSGGLTSTAMVWQEGMADWQPIDAFLAAHPAATASPAKPVVRTAQPRPGPDYSAVLTAGKEKEPSDISRVLRSILAGGVAALVGGGVWVAIALGAGVQIGWLAWGVGALCGWAVSHFGRGHGVVFQLIAVACSLGGIALGKVGILLGGYWPFSLFDLLWVILAVASAWKTAGGGGD